MTTNDDAVGAVVVLTTTADDDSARSLSRALVEEGLAACVTRSAVKSVFRWETSADADDGGVASTRKMRVCEEDEVLLVVKTSRTRVAQLEKRLLELHPYDCPELIRVEPEHVEERYLAWLLAACA